MENKLNQTAIESYSLKITKKLSDDFFQKNLVITGSQILNFTPIEQINLFVISNLFDKWKEETSKLKSPYFDFEHTEVNAALKTFMNVLSKHISIRRAEFDPLLRNAIANALCLTLSPYLFLKENYFSFETPVIQMAEFKERVKFLRLNKVITDAFIRKIEKHNLTSTPLSYALDYLNESYKETSNDLIDAEDIIKEINKLEPVTIEQLVFSYRPIYKPEPIIEAPIVKLEEPKVEAAIEELKLEVEKVIDEILAEDELIIDAPIKQSYIQEEIVMEIIVTEPEKVEIIEEKKVEPTVELFENKHLAEIAQENQAPVLAKSNQNKVVDLKSSITINQKFMFVNELFKGEGKVFTESLEKVETCNNYNEAINMLLETYANRYDWDTDKEEVAEFFELVSRKFVAE